MLIPALFILHLFIGAIHTARFENYNFDNGWVVQKFSADLYSFPKPLKYQKNSFIYMSVTSAEEIRIDFRDAGREPCVIPVLSAELNENNKLSDVEVRSLANGKILTKNYWSIIHESWQHNLPKHTIIDPADCTHRHLNLSENNRIIFTYTDTFDVIEDNRRIMRLNDNGEVVRAFHDPPCLFDDHMTMVEEYEPSAGYYCLRQEAGKLVIKRLDSEFNEVNYIEIPEFSKYYLHDASNDKFSACLVDETIKCVVLDKDLNMILANVSIRNHVDYINYIGTSMRNLKDDGFYLLYGKTSYVYAQHVTEDGYVNEPRQIGSLPFDINRIYNDRLDDGAVCFTAVLKVYHYYPEYYTKCVSPPRN